MQWIQELVKRVEVDFLFRAKAERRFESKCFLAQGGCGLDVVLLHPSFVFGRQLPHLVEEAGELVLECAGYGGEVFEESTHLVLVGFDVGGEGGEFGREPGIEFGGLLWCDAEFFELRVEGGFTH